MADTKKKSRTQDLIERLRVPDSFRDPKLPKGLFSHSQYMSWKICGKAYEFKYVLGISTPNYPTTSRGSAVHKGIEKALERKLEKKPLMPLEEAVAVVSDEFERHAEGVLDWGEMNIGKMKDESIALYKAFHEAALPRINPVAIEKGFAKKFGDVPLVGWIDLIDEQPAMEIPGLDAEAMELAPKKRITVDFKTSASKWSEKDVRLDTQLTLYSEVEGTPHVRVDQLIPYKKGAQYVRGCGERTPLDVQILEEDMNGVADFVRRGIFPMTTIDNWACNKEHCSFYELCRGRQR